MPLPRTSARKSHQSTLLALPHAPPFSAGLILFCTHLYFRFFCFLTSWSGTYHWLVRQGCPDGVSCLHANWPGRVRRPNNSCAERARVRITPCVFADYAVVSIKLLAAHPSMIHMPCLDVAFHIALAMWTLVNKAFTTPSVTESWLPQTVRWSILPVFTLLATFPLQIGQT